MIKRGYDPDPVQEWKKSNLKDDEEEEPPPEDDEESQEGEESTSKPKKVDPGKIIIYCKYLP